jgi:sugar lactone lactonase YvrE
MGNYCSRRPVTPILILLSLMLLLLSVSLAQSLREYNITTVAGTDPSPGNYVTGPYAGEGGLAVNALLNYPVSVALSPKGDLYFCDWNAQIRKIDARTGIITTIAGTGVRGFAGDGGPAIQALLGGPGDIATDLAGDIYFSDQANHRVRRIFAATGIITTIAGNGQMFDPGINGPSNNFLRPALNMAILGPAGLAPDNKGGLYIANSMDGVWKLDLAAGTITMAAGGHGSIYGGDYGPAVLAQMAQPEGIALDTAGNLYIAARGEHRIRKVDAETGIITTIAGTSFGRAGVMGMMSYQGGFSGDGGPATSAILNDASFVSVDAAGNVYISDTNNSRIRRIDAATGRIRTIAGVGVPGFTGDGGSALNAQIDEPGGLTLDFAGRVYFADLANERIRMLSPLQPIQPLLPSTKFRGPVDIGPVDVRK